MPTETELGNNDSTFYVMYRTDLEDEKQINHHGEIRTVKGVDEVTDEPDKTSTPVENISQLTRDLTNIDERVQDKALKEYYSLVVITSDHKRMILTSCIMFSRKVKPLIAATFVVCYWSAGLHNYYRIE